MRKKYKIQNDEILFCRMNILFDLGFSFAYILYILTRILLYTEPKFKTIKLCDWKICFYENKGRILLRLESREFHKDYSGTENNKIKSNKRIYI